MFAQVMYIPSAVALIEGGIYSKGDDGLWDTPEIAKLVLQSMLTNHKKQLKSMNGSSGSSLLQVKTISSLDLFVCAAHSNRHTLSVLLHMS